jgi:hypothetical protein
MGHLKVMLNEENFVGVWDRLRLTVYLVSPDLVVLTPDLMMITTNDISLHTSSYISHTTSD